MRRCDNAILGTPQHPGWSHDVPIHKCEGQAGDCLIFTEKMNHGTLMQTTSTQLVIVDRFPFASLSLPRAPLANWRGGHDTPGTLPWCGSGERRTLFYKYTCWGLHHGDVGYDVTDPSLTARQRSIVEFSSHWFNNPTQPDRQDYRGNPALTRIHPNAQPVGALSLSGRSVQVYHWCSTLLVFVAVAALGRALSIRRRHRNTPDRGFAVSMRVRLVRVRTV